MTGLASVDQVCTPLLSLPFTSQRKTVNLVQMFYKYTTSFEKTSFDKNAVHLGAVLS